MEGITIVKTSELSELLQEIKAVREEIKELQNAEDMKAYSIQEVADMWNIHYNTVRNLALSKKLFSKALDEKNNKGKRIIPAWAVKKYLQDNQK